MVSLLAGASRPSTKMWFSSMRLPSYGRLRRITGPPVVNAKRCPLSSALPSSAVMPDLSVKPQRTPAGRARSKSYTQFLASAQRPLPFSAQSTSNGSSSRGSPKGTIACAKRALTWRTLLTSPCGEKNSTGCARGADIHAAQSDSSTVKAQALIKTPSCLEETRPTQTRLQRFDVAIARPQKGRPAKDYGGSMARRCSLFARAARASTALQITRKPCDAFREAILAGGETPAHESFALGPECTARREAQLGFAHEALAEVEAVGDTFDTEERIHRAGGQRDVDARHAAERKRELIARLAKA